MKFLFLTYVSRSGSTYLAQNILKHSDSVLVIPEIKMLEILLLCGEKEVASRDSRYLLHALKTDERWKKLGVEDDKAIECIENNKGKGIESVVKGFCLLYARKQGVADFKYILLKNGAGLWLDKLANSSIKDYMYIHIRRDPRAVLSSIMRTEPIFSEGGVKVPRSAFRFSVRYKAFMRRIEKISKDSCVNIIDLQYEELCEDLNGTLQVLFKKLGLELVSKQDVTIDLLDMEEAFHVNINGVPLKDRIYAWQSELDFSDGLVCEVINRSYLTLPKYFSDRASLVVVVSSFFSGAVKYGIHIFYWRLAKILGYLRNKEFDSLGRKLKYLRHMYFR